MIDETSTNFFFHQAAVQPRERVTFSASFRIFCPGQVWVRVLGFKLWTLYFSPINDILSLINMYVFLNLI